MTLAYGWLIKTRNRISSALIGKASTEWELNFLQTIDAKFDKYGMDCRLSANQHKRLFLILSRAELLTVEMASRVSAPSNRPSQPNSASNIHNESIKSNDDRRCEIMSTVGFTDGRLADKPSLVDQGPTSAKEILPPDPLPDIPDPTPKAPGLPVSHQGSGLPKILSIGQNRVSLPDPHVQQTRSNESGRRHRSAMLEKAWEFMQETKSQD
jgi:hypothetical protein